MNRLIIIYGCVLLASSAIAAVQQSTRKVTPLKETLQDKEKLESLVTAVEHSGAESEFFSNPTNNRDVEAYDLDISKIEYIEDEVIDLGFDPYDYLPENFNPNSFYLDLTSVEFIDEEDQGLGFDTGKYLPVSFDAYQKSAALTSIHFIEDEDLTLGFDTGKYLPKGFSPYEPYFDLNSINYIEMDDLEDDFLVLPEEEDIIEEPFN